MARAKADDSTATAEPLTVRIVSDEYDPSTCKFETMEDYDAYNKYARTHKMPVKVPTEDFYKKVKVKFQRFDQPENVLKTVVRNREIHWVGQLKPGGTYMLAPPVVKYLNSLSTPIYGEVDVTEDGKTRKVTQQVGERCRFSCQVIDFE